MANSRLRNSKGRWPCYQSAPRVLAQTKSHPVPGWTRNSDTPRRPPSTGRRWMIQRWKPPCPQEAGALPASPPAPLTNPLFALQKTPRPSHRILCKKLTAACNSTELPHSATDVWRRQESSQKFQNFTCNSQKRIKNNSQSILIFHYFLTACFPMWKDNFKLYL